MGWNYSMNLKMTLNFENLYKLTNIHYRSELWYHLFFDDCLNYLNFNSVSDEICTLKVVRSRKLDLRQK